MARAHPEEFVAVNGVELCWQGFGEMTDSPIVLLHGGGDSMLAWRDGFCGRIADGGRYVIRYDGRDSGRSTTYPPGAPPYGLPDLVADAAALIQALGLDRAHVAGLSLGGAVAQLLALDHSERLATLTLLATTPGDAAELPRMEGRIAAVFSAESPEPDWSDRDAVIEYLVEAERPFAGSGGFDASAQREYAARVVDRSSDLAATMTNSFLVEDDPPWRGRLGEIDVPTLVIHGADDPLFPLEHGRALAREIQGARLLVLEGVGHEYPPPATWDTVAGALITHTGA